MGKNISGVPGYLRGSIVRGFPTRKVARRLQGLDWTLLRGSALLSTGAAVARVLGLGVSFVLAAAFSAGDFGLIRYAIAIASIVAIATQPFGQHVIARFVGKHKDEPGTVDSLLSNLFFVLPIIFVLTFLIALPVLHHLRIFNIGILVIFAGQTLFYAYWGLSTGFLDPRRLTVAYLGSNLLQIIFVFLLIRVFGFQSPTLALMIYGLSYVIPVILLRRFWPLPGKIAPHLIQKKVVCELLHFSVPIWISHTCYVLCTSLDLILLQRLVSSSELGAYSLSKTLASVFLFVPEGISTLLMPKVAASPKQTHRQALTKMLVVSLLVNGAGLLAYGQIVKPFTRRIFGADYLVQPSVSIVLALFMIASGIHSMITAVVVGCGRPEGESASRITDLVTTALGCWLLIPRLGGLGAAVSVLAGKAVSLLTYGTMQMAVMRIGNRSLFCLPVIDRE